MNVEAEKSLELLGDEYDVLYNSEVETKTELALIGSQLTKLRTKPEEVDKVLQEFQEYSYAFNVKILGVPELGPTESAEDTSNLCLKIFDALGAHFTSSDIEVAHRVAVTDASRTCSKPIVCKFIRRFARNREMAVRKEACKIGPEIVGSPEEDDMSNIRVVDHLTPSKH